MYLILGIILFLLGLAMIITPKTFYEITEGWKNNVQGEPSKMFLISTKFGGVMCCLVGISGCIINFL